MVQFSSPSGGTAAMQREEKRYVRCGSLETLMSVESDGHGGTSTRGRKGVAWMGQNYKSVGRMSMAAVAMFTMYKIDISF